MKQTKIPFFVDDEILVPLTGDSNSQIILAIIGVEFDSKTGGAVRCQIDPDTAKAQGDALTKDFCFDGFRFSFLRFQWSEGEEPVLIFNIRNK